MKKTLCIFLSLLMIFSCVAVGAVAQGSGYLLITDFVAVNSGKDVADEIQSVIDSNPNRTIFFPDGEYLVSHPVYTPANPGTSVSLKLADFAVIKATGEWTKGEAIIQLGGKAPANDTHHNGSNYSLEGGIIDGNGVANGISINGGRETAVRNTSIKHTVVGLTVKYGVNAGSSDADITGINIIGTGGTDSTGIVLEGFDNTLTNIRIGNVFTGVHVKSSGNVLRNIHPLYYSDYTDFQNSCGFLVESANNWFDYCYSDQFAIGFRTTGYGHNYFHNCFCYWYSPNGGTHTAFKADKGFNSTITNFKAGFKSETEKNIVLSVGALDGEGSIENLEADNVKPGDNTYKFYLKDATVFGRIIGLFSLIFDLIANLFK